jgi:uncharacterized protein (UPF0332 family)
VSAVREPVIRELLAEGLIEKSPPRLEDIETLVRTSEAGLKDARRSIEDDPTLSVSQMYDAIYVACRALVAVRGYRTANEGDYRTVLKFCGAFLNEACSDTLMAFEAAERKRHDEMYDGCFSMDARKAAALIKRAELLVGNIRGQVLDAG